MSKPGFIPRACECTHSLSAFVASLIPQTWMQSPKHCPAVRCQCGGQYYSFSERKSFNSVTSGKPGEAACIDIEW